MSTEKKGVWYHLNLEIDDDPEKWQHEVITSERPVDKENDAYMGIRGWDAIARRQEVFKKYGFGVPPGHKVSLDRNSEAKSGYARCAETFIYLWLLQQEYSEASLGITTITNITRYFKKCTGDVRGFAPQPKRSWGQHLLAWKHMM
jgi:hypothetical protein